MNYCCQCFSFISTLISIYFSLSNSTWTIKWLKVLTVQTLLHLNKNHNFSSNHIHLKNIKVNYCSQCFSFISTLISIYFSLSNSTCTIKWLKVLTVQTLLHLNKNHNFLSNHIHLIIIKVNYCSQCFSFISTFISIFFSLSYSAWTINCLKVLTVQTLCSTYISNRLKYLQFKLSYI